jgi:hypothetical protein
MSHEKTETRNGLKATYWREYNGSDNIYSEHVVIERTLDPDKSASVDFALDMECFSNDAETPLTRGEVKTAEYFRDKFYFSA